MSVVNIISGGVAHRSIRNRHSVLHLRTSRVAREHAHLDFLLLGATLGLIVFSILTLNSATAGDVPGSPHYFVTRQAAYAVVGLIVMGALAFIDYSRFRELKIGLYVGMMALIGGARTRRRHARLPAMDRAPVLPVPALGAREGPPDPRDLGVRDRPHP